MKKIMVTGGQGFLGHEVCRQLDAMGMYEVYAPSHRELDLVNRHQTMCCIMEEKPDAVIHLAAKVGGIKDNMSNPGVFFRDNMLMGIHVLDACAVAKVKKLVIVGTSCSYPRETKLPMREIDLWNGYPAMETAPYGLAKRAVLDMAQAYRKEFGLSTSFVIPTNLYGPSDTSTHVIPDLIRKFITARRMRAPSVGLYGYPHTTRDFLYVSDCADGIIRAMRFYDSPYPVNLGSGVETTISEVVDKIKALTKYSGCICWDAEQPTGQPSRVLDIRRARHWFSWKPTVSLDQGLSWTVGDGSAYYEKLEAPK